MRNSEGPEHRGLRKIRELPKGQQQALREKLRQLADRLRAEAGSRDLDEGFTPPGFAVFSMDTVHEPAPVPRVRHRMASEEQGETERSTDPAASEAENGQSADSRGQRTRRRHRRRAPAAGTAVRLRRSIVPQVDPDGAIRRLRVLMEIDGSLAGSEHFGLRVYAESGSDETCEQPLGPMWQPISAVRINDLETNGGGETEVRIPSPSGVVEIELDEALDASVQLEVDVVRRSNARGVR